MSTKTIPAQVIKTCDCCTRVITRSNSRQDGKLTLKRDALDMQGAPCADATIVMDLCDSCLDAVAEAIRTTANATRAATPKESS